MSIAKKPVNANLVMGVFVAVLAVAVSLQFVEKMEMTPVAGATFTKDDVPKAAEKAIDLYVEVAKSLLGYAVAAMGGLSFLVQKEMENGRSASRGQLALTASIFVSLVVSIFCGISAIQYIADTLARDIAFATPATAGWDNDIRFRHAMQVQYYSFIMGLAFFVTEIFRRLVEPGPESARKHE